MNCLCPRLTFSYILIQSRSHIYKIFLFTLFCNSSWRRWAADFDKVNLSIVKRSWIFSTIYTIYNNIDFEFVFHDSFDFFDYFTLIQRFCSNWQLMHIEARKHVRYNNQIYWNLEILSTCSIFREFGATTRWSTKEANVTVCVLSLNVLILVL